MIGGQGCPSRVWPADNLGAGEKQALLGPFALPETRSIFMFRD